MIANLTQQLSGAKLSSDSTTGMVATQEQQLADCFRQLSEAKAQLSLYAGRGSSRTLDGAIDDLRLQLDDTRAKLKQTNEHIAEQLQVIDQLNAELAQALAEHDRAMAEAAEFEKQIADVKRFDCAGPQRRRPRHAPGPAGRVSRTNSLGDGQDGAG